MKNILYWQNILTTQECAIKESEIIQTLELIQQGEYRRVNLKKLKGSKIPLYRAKINEKERLIFAIIEHHDEKSLLLIDVLTDHKYENCPYLNDAYLKKYLDELDCEDLLVFMNADFQENPITESIESEDLKDLDLLKETSIAGQWRAAFSYHEQQILLDPSQQELLDCTLPAFVEGVAGSGKTCTGFAKILNEVNKPGHGRRILYITMSSRLINEMSDEWDKARKGKKKSNVAFVNYKDFLEVIAEQFQESKLQLVTINHFKEWLARRMTREDAAALRELSIDLMVSEARFLSGLDESLFDQECFITDPELKNIFNLIFLEYKKYLISDQSINIQLTQLSAKKPIADLIIVDEAQAFSGAQLQNIKNATKDCQVMYCYDQYQNLVDDVDHLKWLIHDIARERRSTKTVLTQGHRCQEKVAGLANKVLDLRAMVSGKSKAATSQARLTARTNNGHCDWISKSVFEQKQLISQFNVDNCNWAVVIPNEDRAVEARSIFGETLNIFTQEQIRGLEYEYIILLSPFEDMAFKQIQKVLSKKSTEHEKYVNISDQERLNCRIALSKLFTASTRSKNSLLIVADKSNYRVLNEYLMPSVLAAASDEAHVNLELTEASSEADWHQKAIKMIKEGLDEQARAILIKHCPSFNPEEEILRFRRNVSRVKGRDLSISTACNEDIEELQSLEQDSIFNSASNVSESLAASCSETSCLDEIFEAKVSLLHSTSHSHRGGGGLSVTPISNKKNKVSKKEIFTTLLEEQHLSLLEGFLKDEITTPDDILSFFCSDKKTRTISKEKVQLFETRPVLLNVLKDIISRLNFKGYFPFLAIANFIEKDQSFFKKLVLDINSHLHHSFFKETEKSALSTELSAHSVKQRAYFFREIFLAIVEASLCQKDPSNDAKEMIAEEFLLMLDYYAAEGHLGPVDKYFLEIWNERGDGYFLFDEILNGYNKDYFPYKMNYSLGELFLNIRYSNLDLIYAILLHNPDCYDEIDGLLRDSALLGSVFIEATGYDKLLMSAYLKAKFYITKDPSFYLERFVETISTKRGLQELLTLLTFEPDFFKSCENSYWLKKRSDLEDFSENYFLEYDELFNDFNNLSDESWVHTWFINCLKDKELWPEFRALLFFIEHPFMGVVLDVLEQSSNVRNTFLGHQNSYFFLNAFLTEEEHVNISLFRNSLLQHAFSVDQIKECTSQNQVKDVRFISIGTLMQIANDIFESRCSKSTIIRHRAQKIYQIVCQNNLEEFERFLSDSDNINFINHELPWYFDLQHLILITNNYRFLVAFRGLGNLLGYNQDDNRSSLLYAHKIGADQEIFDLIESDIVTASGGFNLREHLQAIPQEKLINEVNLIAKKALTDFNPHMLIQIVHYLFTSRDQNIFDDIDIYAEALKVSLDQEKQDCGSLVLLSQFHRLMSFNFEDYQIAHLINPQSLYDVLLMERDQTQFEDIAHEINLFEYADEEGFIKKLNPPGKSNLIHKAILNLWHHQIQLFKTLGVDINHENERGLTPMDLFSTIYKKKDWTEEHYLLYHALTSYELVEDFPEIRVDCSRIDRETRDFLYMNGYSCPERNSVLTIEEASDLPIGCFVAAIDTLVSKKNIKDPFALSRIMKAIAIPSDRIVEERTLFETSLNRVTTEQTYDYLLGWLKFDREKRIYFTDLILDSILKKNLEKVFLKFLKDEHWQQMAELWKNMKPLLVANYNLPEKKEDVILSYLLRAMYLVDNCEDILLKSIFYIKTASDIAEKYDYFHHPIADKIIDLYEQIIANRVVSSDAPIQLVFNQLFNSDYSQMPLRYIQDAVKYNDLMIITAKVLPMFQTVSSAVTIPLLKKLLLEASEQKYDNVINLLYNEVGVISQNPYPENNEEQLIVMRVDFLRASDLKKIALLHRQRGIMAVHPDKTGLADIGNMHDGFRSHPRDPELIQRINRSNPLYNSIIPNTPSLLQSLQNQASNERDSRASKGKKKK